MKIYTGKSIFDGIAIGKVKVYQKRKQKITDMKIADVEAEVKRYKAAKATAISQLGVLYKKTMEEIGESNAAIFEAHQMMLEDDDYNESVYSIIRDCGMNAEYAVATTGDNFSKIFAEMEDDYFRARAVDVKDISERVVNILASSSEGTDYCVADEVNCGDEPIILVAKELTPSETVQFDKSKVLSFITMHGSSNSHTAILARMMNIPALIGIEPNEAWDGQMAIVDGKKGVFIVNPNYSVLEEYVGEKKNEEEVRFLLASLKGLSDETTDGRKIKLYANAGNIADVAEVLANDAAGIGLFRSEFLYLEKDDYPTEEEQFAVYKTVAQNMAGRQVIIRTLDIGADKQAGYFKIDKEENPALGYRAIRICLDRIEMFKTQLRALYRASAFGTISIMFPMIISVSEVREIKRICEEVKAELDEKRITYGEVELGIMIETPAAAMISDLLAEEVDFFSIGTNDLTQYTLAIDRQNPKLDNIYESHHPAVLRMIQMVIDNGHRHGCWVGICGELAADTSLTETFVNMGIDEFSVSPAFVLPIRKIIREM